MSKNKAGQRLRALRGEKRIVDVAKSIGVCPSALSMYELGNRTPRDAVKVRLAEFYGVSVGSIFFAD